MTSPARRTTNVRLLAASAGLFFAMLAGSSAAAAEPFGETQLYFELNATDGDVGLQGLIDGDAWTTAQIFGPGRSFSVIRAVGNSDSPDFGINEFFFESNEPTLEERSFRALTSQFPPGRYEFRARTIDNGALRGEALLTIGLPCPAVLRAPRSVKGDLVIRWRLQPGVFDPDTQTCSAAGAVTPTVVHVSLELTDTESGAVRTFTADMPPNARAVEAPDEFLAGVDPEKTEAKASVLVIEESGNRTSVEIAFEL